MLKCVDYDKEFAQQIFERFGEWVPRHVKARPQSTKRLRAAVMKYWERTTVTMTRMQWRRRTTTTRWQTYTTFPRALEVDPEANYINQPQYLLLIMQRILMVLQMVYRLTEIRPKIQRSQFNCLCTSPLEPLSDYLDSEYGCKYTADRRIPLEVVD